MIYYSSTKKPGPSHLTMARTRQLTALSLGALPASVIMSALGGGGTAGVAFDLAAIALVAISVFAALPVLGSNVQRIVAGVIGDLDEFELALRQRAVSHAYAVFTAIVLVAILYCALATDFGWWLPRGYEALNRLFWGGFLYATLLPAAILAWSRDAQGLD